MADKLLVVLVFVFCWSGVALADTYRWEDADGNVYYSDMPPPAGARNIQRERRVGDAGEAAPAPLPYELQLPMRNFPVTLYVTDCGDACDQARALLIERGIPHTLLDATKPDVQQAMKALPDGRLDVPTMTVGKIVLWGFEADRWNDTLTAAQYPSEALIKVTPTIPRVAGAASDDSNADDAELESGESDDADADSGDLADIESDEVEDDGDADDTGSDNNGTDDNGETKEETGSGDE